MDLTKFATLSSLFALLMVVSAKILIPMNGELISIQLFFVVLAGLVGGNMIGLTAQLIYMMFGFFVPVFYNNEMAQKIRQIKVPVIGLQMDVAKYPDFLAIKLYEDNFIQFTGNKKEMVIDYLQKVKKVIESYGVRCELEGVPSQNVLGKGI